MMKQEFAGAPSMRGNTMMGISRTAGFGDGVRLVAWVGRAAAKVWMAWYRRRVVARTIHALWELDDRALHDIGVHRSEITSVARAAASAPGARHRRRRR